MLQLSSPRRLILGCSALALALLGACADGEDSSITGFSGSYTGQPTQVTSASQSGADTTGLTDGATTGLTDGATTQSATVTEASTGDPATTTGVDPSTTTGVDPATTTGVDPSTTTDVDPSTTTGVDPSTTTGMTGMTGMTTMEDTTGEPMMPPPKDPQPNNGLYESCVNNDPCDLDLTDGCFTITDSMTMMVIDGYCTILCNNVNDCGPAPKAPAVQECFAISANQKVCGLKCKGVADCPTGMACTGLSLPNNQTGSYCT